MTRSRIMLATALFGSLALPALAQPAAGAHGLRTVHGHVARHATVHRVAAQGATVPGSTSSAPSAAAPVAPATPRLTVATPPAGPATLPGSVTQAPLTGAASVPATGVTPHAGMSAPSVMPAAKPGLTATAPSSTPLRVTPGMAQPGSVRVN